MSEPHDLIQRLEHACVRMQTQTGPASRMVWRSWGQGKPLVLLHGGAGTWLHWVRNIDTLARRRRVLVPDLPGFGDSDLPGDGLDADTIAPMVLRGLGDLLGDERFDLVGFSFGALVAGYLAARKPAHLDSLVLVSVAGLGIMGDFAALQPLRGTAGAQREAALRNNLRVVMLRHDASIDALALAAQEAGVARERVRNRKLATMEVLPRLSAEWTGPVHAIWSAQDAIYKGRVADLAAKVPQLRLRSHVILDEPGHWLQFEAADQFHESLWPMLQATSSTEMNP